MYTIHLCTGGLAHMLKLLGTTISYCKVSGRTCVIYSENHAAFLMPFYDIFTPTNKFVREKLLVSEREYADIISNYAFNSPINAPPILSSVKLQYYGTEELGNKYALVKNNLKYSYNLELNEDEDKTPFQLTTGQRCDRKNRKLNLIGGWQSSLTALKINDYIINEALLRQSELMDSYIGVHFRNTDMKHDINTIFDDLRNTVLETKINQVFLATDDISSLELFRSEFPELVFKSLSEIPDYKKLGQKSIHYMSIKAMDKAGLSKKKQVEDALCDILCLADSTHFIASRNSAMSHLVQFLRENQGIAKIFAKNFFS